MRVKNYHLLLGVFTAELLAVFTSKFAYIYVHTLCYLLLSFVTYKYSRPVTTLIAIFGFTLLSCLYWLPDNGPSMKADTWVLLLTTLWLLFRCKDVKAKCVSMFLTLASGLQLVNEYKGLAYTPNLLDLVLLMLFWLVAKDVCSRFLTPKTFT